MNIESQIWDFIHSFKLNTTKDERLERYKVAIVGDGNFYLVSFPVENRRIMQFRIEKSYRLTSTFYYRVSKVCIDRSELPGDQDKINEILYKKIIPLIRELKLDNLGI